MLEQRVMLEHEADLALAHMACRCILAVQQHAAVIGRFQPRDDAQQRGLAATGRAEQRRQFAGRKIQRYIVQGDELPNCL